MDNTHQTAAGDTNAECSPCSLLCFTPLAVQHQVPHITKSGYRPHT